MDGDLSTKPIPTTVLFNLGNVGSKVPKDVRVLESGFFEDDDGPEMAVTSCPSVIFQLRNRTGIPRLLL